MDRGGLWHVREATFLFCAFEEETSLHVRSLSSSTASTTHEFLDKLLESEDVQFYWCITTAAFDVEDIDVHTAINGRTIHHHSWIFLCWCMARTLQTKKKEVYSAI